MMFVEFKALCMDLKLEKERQWLKRSHFTPEQCCACHLITPLHQNPGQPPEVETKL